MRSNTLRLTPNLVDRVTGEAKGGTANAAPRRTSSFLASHCLLRLFLALSFAFWGSDGLRAAFRHQRAVAPPVRGTFRSCTLLGPRRLIGKSSHVDSGGREGEGRCQRLPPPRALADGPTSC